MEGEFAYNSKASIGSSSSHMGKLCECGLKVVRHVKTINNYSCQMFRYIFYKDENFICGLSKWIDEESNDEENEDYFHDKKVDDEFRIKNLLYEE